MLTNRLNKDTTFLLQRRDTSTLSNRINLKVNYNATQAVLGRVEIYDLKGAKVLDQKLVLADADNYPVNVESLNRGVYLVKTFDVDNNEIVKTKLVKE
jgi:hypothetical protein